jgi:hypothetical protein
MITIDTSADGRGGGGAGGVKLDQYSLMPDSDDE